MIIGDEYLSAPTDPRPKIFIIKPQLTVITSQPGIIISMYSRLLMNTQEMRKRILKSTGR